MDRRSALRLIAIGATSPVFHGFSANALLALGRKAHAQVQRGDGLRTLNPSQHRTVLAATECILPETDTPGAAEAHVDRFIDVIVADWYSPNEQERFVFGIDELEELSQERFARRFADCRVEEQFELLDSIDRDHFDDSEHWFGMLKHLTIWGYFTSEVGVERELAKHTRQGMWQGCATDPRLERQP